jgi:hypothetical protein
MKKTIVLLATLGLAVLLASGLALAAPKGKVDATLPRTIICEEGTSSCQGTSGPDTIYGTKSSDVIIPYAGDDTVYAYGGNDEVRHSFGDDIIEGGLGADTLRGGFGHDTIFGNTPQTPFPPDVVAADTPDKAPDLIDCAYLESRKDSGPDEGFGELTDTVVDCSNRDL